MDERKPGALSAVDRWLGAHPYAMALAVACIGYVALAPWGHLFGTGGEYAHPTSDLEQGMTGAFAYIDDSWRWPLFETKRLDYPMGANIIYMDAEPIVALLFKIIGHLFGVRVNYLGLWFAVVWLGQAAGAVFLLRSLAVTRWLTLLTGVIICLTLPPFLTRHTHLPISSHFVLLFTLGIYWRMVKGTLSARRCLLAALLIAVLVWVTFYLFTMAAVIYAAALLDARRNGRMAIGTALAAAALVVFPALLLMWIGGYFGYSSAAGGFGLYSMNLLSPVAPQSSGWFGGPPYFDATGGQSEGFQYLGMGIIAAGIFVLARGLGGVRRRGRVRCRYLVAACIALTLFALSNHVYAGSKELLTFHIDERMFPFSAYRASGRFFWPVGYLAVALTIAKLDAFPFSNTPKLGALAMMLLLGVQVVDVHHFISGLRQQLQGPSDVVSPTETLARLFEAHDFIHISPKYACAGPPTQARVADLIFLAAKLRRPVDNVYTSRFREPPQCHSPVMRARDDDGTRHLYVGLAGQVAVSDSVPLDEFCRKLGGLSLCSNDSTELSLLDETEAGISPYVVPACQEQMTFGPSGGLPAAAVAGWSYPEVWGAWSVAKTAIVECRLPAGTGGDPVRALSIVAQGFAPGTGHARVRTEVRGGGSATVDVPHLAKTEWQVAVGRSATLILVLTTESLLSPAEAGLSSDERTLGVGLMSIDLVRAPK